MIRTPRSRTLALYAVAALLVPAAASAQVPTFMVVPRGGAGVPFGSFADGGEPGEGASQGPSAGVAFGLSRGSSRTWMLGFSQHRFDCVDAGCREDGEYVGTGIDFGVRFNFGVTRPVTPWLRLGAVTSRLELDGAAGGGVTGLGFGGEVGAGAYIRLAEKFGLDPGVRVVAVNGGLPGGGTLGMRYWVADLGLALAF